MISNSLSIYNLMFYIEQVSLFKLRSVKSYRVIQSQSLSFLQAIR